MSEIYRLGSGKGFHCPQLKSVFEISSMVNRDDAAYSYKGLDVVILDGLSEIARFPSFRA